MGRVTGSTTNSSAWCQTRVTIPVIASSGAGEPSHFTDVFNATECSAALAAGIFHRGEVDISEVKDHMKSGAIPTNEFKAIL